MKVHHHQHGSSGGHTGLVTPPSPRSLSADWNRLRQRRKRTSVSRARGRLAYRGGGDDVDCGVESECSTTSMQQRFVDRIPILIRERRGH